VVFLWWFFVVKLWSFCGGLWCVDGGFTDFEKMSLFENNSVEKAREGSGGNSPPLQKNGFEVFLPRIRAPYRLGNSGSSHSELERRSRIRTLLPIGNPDVFDLRCMLHEVASIALLVVEPIDIVLVVGPHLLQIADRGSLHKR
jgi:hypothetical protein